MHESNSVAHQLTALFCAGIFFRRLEDKGDDEDDFVVLPVDLLDLKVIHYILASLG